MSKSTNNDGASLSDHLNRLAISTAVATPLPPSSPVNMPATSPNGNKNLTTSGQNTPKNKTPLRRAPSSSSLASSERSTTPTLHKRTSMGSLQRNGGATPPRSPAVRRTSSYVATSPSMGVRSSLPPSVEEPPRPPVTASSVAHDFFKKELELHQEAKGLAEHPQTVVILQDDCYGHRYSRPRTSRANLGTIVERPERIHASILGLATAYVRLGGRHSDGVAAPHPKRPSISLPTAPFRIYKTSRRLPLRSPAVTAVHGVQWMSELTQMCDAAESKLATVGKELTRPGGTDHGNSDSHLEKPVLHEGDLYLCSESLNALEGALGGVCEGIDIVFKDHGPKRAFVCIRPPGHHCSADMPSGFCWLNNVHVGIGHAVLTHGLTHAAIIDFDLHHGDGSQAITWAHNSKMASMPKNTPISKKTAIGYFSVHDINSYPCEMGDDEKVRNASICVENAHGQNIWNVHLQSWKTEAEFWKLYEEKYSVVLVKARSFLRLHSEKLRQAPTHPKPKGAIFLSAGFDASEWESPGMQRHQVNVPTSFYARLTRDVVAMAEEEGLGVNGRVISVLEGGYSDRALMSGVLSHISGLTTPLEPLSGQTKSSNGLGLDMGRRMGRLDIDNDSAQALTNGLNSKCEPYDTSWWSLPRLEEVEILIQPQNTTAPRGKKSETRPTYTSTTQSYTAKIVSPPQGRRSFSGAGANLQHGSITRSPTPPPPAVDWATAAHELSKLLVPSDRETKSCRPEDLNAEASRVRRDRYSTVGLPKSANEPVPIIDAKRMQLRDRTGKTPQYVSEDEDLRPASRTDRRKTIADVSMLTEGTEPAISQASSVGVGFPARHTRRRSSMASNASSVTAEKGSDFSLGSTIAKEMPVVKKSRAPTSSRAEAVKPKPIKKQPPVPRFPSTSSTATSIPEERQSLTAPATEMPKQLSSLGEDHNKEDLDQLAAGMRKMKIKLNVPSREEYEAKQTKSKPAPKGRPSKPTANKVPSPGKARARTIKQLPSPKSPPTAPPYVFQPDPPITAADHAQEPTAALPPPATQLFLEPTIPEVPATASATSTLPPEPLPAPYKSDIEMPNTVPAPVSSHDEEKIEIETPPSAPQPDITSRQADLNPPSTPVTAKRTKQDLPVFTSTSPIAFGKPNAIPSSIDQALSEEDHTTSGAIDHSHPTSMGQQSINASNPTGVHLLEDKGAKMEGGTNSPSANSIWDVPDTPQPRTS